MIQIARPSHLPTFNDLHPQFGPIVHTRWYSLNFSHTQHALSVWYYSPKDNVLAIKERGLGRRDEKLTVRTKSTIARVMPLLDGHTTHLASIGVLATIGHAQKPRLRVFDRKVLVLRWQELPDHPSTSTMTTF
jgi:hypothetical protein